MSNIFESPSVRKSRRRRERDAVYWAGVEKDKAAEAEKLSPIIEAVIRDVAELPDRTSPEGHQEMMLVSADELRNILIINFGRG